MNTSKAVSAAVLLVAAAAFSTPVFAAKSKSVTAKAELVDAEGKPIGRATLEQASDGVKVSLEARGLTPGAHGIHFHETGNCTGPDFKSAGAHFNPTSKSHGLTHPEGHHTGDLPNLTALEDGTVKTEFVAKGATLKPGKTSLLKQGGTALVIHAKADDGKTQPSGDSGDRVACGVVKP